MQRWPRLQKLPQEVARAAACRPLVPGALQLSDFFSQRLGQWEDLGCPPGRAVFPARLFFREAGESTKTDLFHAMVPQFAARPSAMYEDQFGILKWALKRHVRRPADMDGLFLEFGAFCGATANLVASHLRRTAAEHKLSSVPQLYSFDSFRGLPRAWGALSEGAFNLGSCHLASARRHRFRVGQVRKRTAAGLAPFAEPNVEWVVGYFNQSLAPFLQGLRAATALAKQRGYGSPEPRLALAYLDADLYESTREVLEGLAPLLGAGTILVFDDFFGSSIYDDTLEIWDAFFQALRADWWRWDVEVLRAPWHAGVSGPWERGGAVSAVALRLVE